MGILKQSVSQLAYCVNKTKNKLPQVQSMMFRRAIPTQFLSGSWVLKWCLKDKKKKAKEEKRQHFRSVIYKLETIS